MCLLHCLRSAEASLCGWEGGESSLIGNQIKSVWGNKWTNLDTVDQNLPNTFRQLIFKSPPAKLVEGAHQPFMQFIAIYVQYIYRIEYINVCVYIYIYIYTHCPSQKKAAWSLLEKTAFCFDYGTLLLWHCFDNLIQCHNNFFHPELHSFLAEILYWWQESQTITSAFSFTPNTFNGLQIRTL